MKTAGRVRARQGGYIKLIYNDVCCVTLVMVRDGREKKWGGGGGGWWVMAINKA